MQIITDVQLPVRQLYKAFFFNNNLVNSWIFQLIDQNNRYSEYLRVSKSKLLEHPRIVKQRALFSTYVNLYFQRSHNLAIFDSANLIENLT